MRRFIRALGVTAAAGTAAALLFPPGGALADTGQFASSRTATVTRVQEMNSRAGSIGACHVGRGNAFAGGWCEGSGPDWTYQGVVTCADGETYLAVSRWAGDRRGSYAECPSGSSTATQGGVRYYYQGSYQGSVLV